MSASYRSLACALLAVASLLPFHPLSAQAPVVTATKTDNTAAPVATGGTISYTNTISVTNATATGVVFTNSNEANTSMVPGSLHASPLALPDVYGTVGNTTLYVGVTMPTSVAGVALPASQALLANDTTITDSTQVAGASFPLAITTGNGGSVSLNQDGSFTYTPAVGFTGTDTFSYTARNSVDATLTDTAVVTVTVSGRVWYAKNGGTGDGRSSTPAGNTATVSAAANAAGDVIYVYRDPVALSGVLTLDPDQSLIGEGVALVVNSTTLRAAGTPPVLANTGGNILVLAGTGGARTVSGVAFGDRAAGGSAISNPVANFGTLTVTSDVSISGSGAALSLNTGTLSATFSSISTSGATSPGISLTAVAGNLTINGGSLANGSGAGLFISGGTANVTSNGTISGNTGAQVSIDGKTAGTVTFNGAISGTVQGISLSNNSGATINFTGGMLVATTTNPAFRATGGGTVNVVQDVPSNKINVLSTTTATAVEISNTTIGANHATFRSVASNGGAANGIILNNTGTTGGFRVVGDGSASSGGIIQSKTDADGSTTGGSGIYLNNTADVQLSSMQVRNCSNYALRGLAVAGLTLSNCVITTTAGTNGTSDVLDEGSVVFGIRGGSNGLTGTATFTGCTFENGFEESLGIYNSSGSLNLIVNGGIIRGAGNDGVSVELQGSASATVEVKNATLSSNVGDHFQATANGASTLNVLFGTNGGNTCTSGAAVSFGQGLIIQTGGQWSGSGTFNISNNSISNAVDNPININAGGPGTLVGTINNNTIGTAGVANSGTTNGEDAIRIVANGDKGALGANANGGTLTVAITNNLIQQMDANGIYAIARDGGSVADPIELNLTITGNTLRQPSPLDPLSGIGNAIRVEAGASSTPTPDRVRVRANIGGTGALANIIQGDWLGDELRLRHQFSASSDFILTDLGADTSTVATVGAYLLGRNTLDANRTATATIAGGGVYKTGGAPPAPLFFAIEEAAPLPVAEAAIQRVTEAPVSVPPSLSVQTEEKEQMQTQAATPAHAGLTQAELDRMVAAARARWVATGLTPAQLAALDKLVFTVADLPGWQLGEAAGHSIRVDNNAGGNGWFLDPSPDEDSEFHGSTAAGAALKGVDLLTTVLHEMGHAIGLCDTYSKLARHSVMYGFLNVGERRLPRAAEAVAAVPHEHEAPHFLSAPLTIGSIPAGKTITIKYQVVVNSISSSPALPPGVRSITSQGTVSGSNFTTVSTNDPDTPAAGDATVTTLDLPDTTLAFITNTGSSPTNAASVTWQAIFGTGISGVNASAFTLVNTGLTGSPAITAVTPVGADSPTGSGLYTTWSITAGTGGGQGTLGLNFTSDLALTHDITNKPVTGDVVTVDRIPPSTTSFARLTPSSNITNADTLVYRVTFSENVVNVDAADFAVTGTTATVTGVAASTGSSVFDVTISGGNLASLNGTVGLNFSGAQNIADSVGNALPSTEPVTDETYVLDNTAPTVAMSSATSDPASNGQIPVTVTFSESVTGFISTEITPTNGSVSNFSGSGTTYTFNLTPSGPGVTVTADIAAGVASDAAGNASTAAAQFSRAIRPVVTSATTTLPASATSLTIAGQGFSTTPSSNTVVFNNGVTGVVTAASSTELTVTSLSGLVSGNLTAVVTVNGVSNGTAVQVATVVPVVTVKTATIYTASTSLVIDGFGFSTTPSNNTLVFNGTATGTVTAATNTSLTVTGLSGLTAGNLTAVVTSNAQSSGAPVQVATVSEGIEVTNTNDSGTGSLRDALSIAATNPGADRVIFSGPVFTDVTPDTITLTTGQLVIASDVEIQGPVAARLTVSGGGASRVFKVTAGTSVISRVSVTGGNGNAGGGAGGDGSGGGVFNQSGNLTLVDCDVSGNTATGSGGGVFYSDPSGGLTLIRCTVSGNTATGTGGGGVWVFGAPGRPVRIISSTLSGNSGGLGGGLGAVDTDLVLINSTISGNTSSSHGGGIHRDGSTGSMLLSNVTVTGNRCASGSKGGGISLVQATTETLRNTIIIGNFVGASPSTTASDIEATPSFGPQTINTASNTLIGDAGTAAGVTHGSSGNIVGNAGTGSLPASAVLNAALASNGGPTLTHRLVNGSPALQAGDVATLPPDTFDLDGDSNTTEPLPVDQRGVGSTRAVGALDLGAVEEQRVISLAATDASKAEGSGGGSTAYTFTVSRVGSVVGAATVDYAVTGSGSNPANATDFGGPLPSGQVTIPDGSASATLTINVSKDATVERDEGFTVTLSTAPAGAVFAAMTATGTITNDDSATLTVAKVNDGAETNTPVNGVFRITQSAASAETTTVAYTVAGTATSGSDYTALSGTATIPAGSTFVDVEVSVLNDAIVEATETVSLTLASISTSHPSVTLGATLTATLDITDNDIATVTLAKINDGAEAVVPTNALFRVTQTAVSSTNTVVTYSVSGTALSGSDFTALSGSVTILAGSTSADITVAVFNDNVVEPVETVDLTLTGFTTRDADISLGSTVQASANITSDDTAVVTLAVVSADKSEGTGGGATAFTFSATLDKEVPGGFTVDYAATNGTATLNSDYVLSGSSITFSGTAEETRQITVLVTQDSDYELDEDFTVSLGAITGAAQPDLISTAGSPKTGVIRNDDALVVSISATDGSADENAATTGAWRITRNSVVGSTTVNLQISAASTAVAADWTQAGATFASLAAGSTGTITIPAGSTSADITLTPVNDIHAEAAESVILNVTADAGYGLGTNTATITIEANDLVVINSNDGGEGSLRQAVANANSFVTDDTVTFATPQTVALTTGEILVQNNGRLVVQGQNTNSISGSASSRVFNIAPNAQVTLRGLWIKDGKSLSNGGAIYNEGTLSVVSSTISGSTASGAGGGIYNASSLIVANSTLSGNTATGAGGAIGNESGNANIGNSTVSSNGSGGNGGGLYSNNGVLVLNTSTITNNNASGGAGGGVYSDNGNLELNNSIIAGNAALAASKDLFTTAVSANNNLIGVDSGHSLTTGFRGHLVGTLASPLDPLLGNLANNGGPTQTHMLRDGSPAINAGSNTALQVDTFDVNENGNSTERISVDQRGATFARVIGTTVDLGAYEAFAFRPAITAATFNEDTQNTSGLVVTPNTADGGLTTAFKITNIQNGTLYKNDGTTVITSGTFLTLAEGAAGLKFTPSLNLNSPTSTFGFDAQATVDGAETGLRTGVATASITITPVNDAPTVVASGIEDQTILVTVSRSVGLGMVFNDVDADTLTYTVETNTNPAKASASISGSNVVIQGLTAGTTDITIKASDGNGGSVTDTFRIFVGTPDPTPGVILPPAGGYVVSQATGTLILNVPITNTTPADVNGFRVAVDLSSFQAQYPGLRLAFTTSAPGVTPAYIDYPYPVAQGATVNFRLDFYSPNRTYPNPLNPPLTITTLATSQPAAAVGPGVPATIRRTTAGEIVIEWASTPGTWYRVQFSNDMVNWYTSTIAIQALANRSQWYDNGAPFTNAPPVGSRFYRVMEGLAPAPPPPPP